MRPGPDALGRKRRATALSTRPLPRRRQQGSSVFDDVDAWLDRVQIVDEGDDEVAKFLDTLDLHGPQEREMLEELARETPLAKPDEFLAAHRRAVASLETLGRHGYRSAVIPHWLKPAFFGRFVVELVARYVVVSYLRRVSTEMRNLYWLRAIQSPVGSNERILLRRARVEAEGLMVVFKRRELGLPSFVVGGVLIPVVLALVRLIQGLSLGQWWASVLVAVVGALVVLLVSAVALRGDGEPAHPARDAGPALRTLGRGRRGGEAAARPEPEVRRRRDRRHHADVVRRPRRDRDRRPDLAVTHRSSAPRWPAWKTWPSPDARSIHSFE